MALTNYTDVSPEYTDTDAGFQFEFRCADCAYRWRSPLEPYRRGRLAGWLFNLNYLISGARASEAASRRVAESGAGQARDDALATARQLATAHFSECDTCRKAFCVDCFDADARQCNACAHTGKRDQQASDSQQAHATSARSTSPDCPNCGTASHGGRFCAECGFDMASTHKSCPGCGAMTERSVRFCGDCGHGF